MFTLTKKFPQDYLFWAPKLDVPKIGIPLSKWTLNIPLAEIVVGRKSSKVLKTWELNVANLLDF